MSQRGDTTRVMILKEWVARRVSPTTRRADLEWEHHLAVAVFSTAKTQRLWLERAAERRWTPDQLRAEIATAMARLLEGTAT